MAGNSARQLALSGDHNKVGRKRKAYEMPGEMNDASNTFYNKENMANEAVREVLVPEFSQHGNKKEKGQKMNVTKMRQCAIILKDLMSHHACWIFNEPVDPVKLVIPDYFSIISMPMDLGTVKGKLECKFYLSTQEFAADVKLTFSNAMRYNPPDNYVHVMAKELNSIFISRWKSLEENWRRHSQSDSLPIIKDGHSATLTRVVCRKSTDGMTSSTKNSLTYEQNMKMGNNFPCAVRSKIDQSCLQASQKDYSRTGLKQECGDDKTQTKLLARISCRCSSMDCCCSKYNENTRPPFGLRKSFGRTSQAPSAYNSNAEMTTKKQNAVLNYSSPGYVDVHNEKSDPSPPSCPLDISMKGGDHPPEELLLLSKALRAATLKNRFADTILKAREITLLSHGEKIDSRKMQQEREKLEKQQKEEKERIEAQIKAAEAAARRKTEEELRKREKEREAARLALQMMKRTVDLDENRQTLKDIDSLYYEDPEGNFEMQDFTNDNKEQSSFFSPLEELGLFMKTDDFDEQSDG